MTFIIDFYILSIYFVTGWKILMEHRAVIIFHAKFGTSGTETFRIMQKLHGSKGI